MYQASAYNTYAKNNVEIESPQKLIKMLYEGILRFNTQAKRAMKEDDIERRAYWTNRSISIFVELINNLDMSQGQVAQYLNALYQYQLNLLAKANLEKNELYLDEVNSVIRGLLEAWKEVTDVEQ
jgi:flagellar protein FliS